MYCADLLSHSFLLRLFLFFAAASNYQHPGFTTPLVPWLPAIGVSFNYFLLAQLSWEGIRDLMLYLAASLLLYLLYGYRNSVGGRNGYVLTV